GLLRALNNLGMLYYNHGQYNDAKPLLERAAALAKTLDDSNVSWRQSQVIVLKNLGVVLLAQGLPDAAERQLERGVQLAQEVFGPQDLETMAVLHELAKIAYDRKRYTSAERLYSRVLTARESVFGLEHHEVATAASNLGAVYAAVKRYRDA